MFRVKRRINFSPKAESWKSSLLSFSRLYPFARRCWESAPHSFSHRRVAVERNLTCERAVRAKKCAFEGEKTRSERVRACVRARQPCNDYVNLSVRESICLPAHSPASRACNGAAMHSGLFIRNFNGVNTYAKLTL